MCMKANVIVTSLKDGGHIYSYPDPRRPPPTDHWSPKQVSESMKETFRATPLILKGLLGREAALSREESRGKNIPRNNMHAHVSKNIHITCIYTF